LVELTNICNADCIYCGYGLMKRDKGVMDNILFKKLIDDFDSSGGGDINLTGIVGEPSMDSNVVEKIEYASRKKKIRNIKISTNGILLDKVGIKSLLESGLDSILVNIGGMDEDSYMKLFGVDYFLKVFENMKVLLNINREKGNKVALTAVIKVISVGEVLQNENYLSLKEIAKDCNAKLVLDKTYDSWCGRISNDDMIGDMELKPRKNKREPCSLLFTTMSITWNGNIVPCCRDLDGEVILGSTTKQSVDEIWRGEKMGGFREKFIDGDIPEMCMKCEHYEGLRPLKTLHLLKQSLKQGRNFKISKFNY
jgi:radical SAM protein with 4Fe4S-binding SPASM domain